jgi:hypothetical protein
MARRRIGGLIALVLLAPTLRASKEEKQAKKLDKELKKISLTASVADGRRVVNRVMAEQLGVSRKQLVAERRKTGFVYGQLFGTHEVGRLASLKFDQIAEQMKQGHSLLGISEQHNVDLKEILADAKALNKRIERELDRVANGDENEQAEDTADSYDPSDDSLSADTADFSPTEIAQANSQVHNRGFGPGGPFGGGRGQGVGLGAGRGPGGGIGGGMGGIGGGTGGGQGRGRH